VRTLLAVVVVGVGFGIAAAAGDEIASIALYNPTSWQGPALVEVPTGRLASPGLIDWTKVRIESDAKKIPFAIREGRAHWRAQLTTPGASPRAEDLLVFWVTVPPGSWTNIRIVPGPRDDQSAVVRDDGLLHIRYRAVAVTIDEGSGQMTEAMVHGQSMLAAPMTATLWSIGDGGYRITGSVGPGYSRQHVTFDKVRAIPMGARVVALSTTRAMTEVHLVLEGAEGPRIGMTYRIHAEGLIELFADERPWQNESPWLNHAFELSFPLNGERSVLPFLESRLPFYGFKDYGAVVTPIANRYDLPGLALVELGEEIANGRSWSRRIFAFATGEGTQAADWIEMATEGLVVNVHSLSAPMPTGRPPIEYPAEATEAGRMLERVLAETSGTDTAAAAPLPDIPIQLVLSPETDVEEDGFEIRPGESGEIAIRASNTLGLWQAVRAVARHERMHGPAAGIPLIASNPVVPIRAGGFGGGTFEVDFPYGTDAEWVRTFDALLDSGMNVFWCLGMWSNWKLPVSYHYMPEIRSDSPDAYDESSGARFSELDQHRERGLKLTRYLQDRGGKVCVWLPIGCVPTTFAAKYPEAMSTEGEFRVPGTTPCFTHPQYRTYIDAFLRELTETYPLDGVVMVRDDNGGVCTCGRCKDYVAQSRTKNAVWEQYLLIYDWLRAHEFRGTIGVYPYFDGYAPDTLEAQLPADLFVGGHGASTAILTRPHERIGHMGDTWLDNLYANFRLPSSTRMRQLLSDRCSFWIGGAYRGTELPWEAIGYFGWEPTATPNTFRHEWGARTFGKKNALMFVALSNTYEALWDINARYLLPLTWMQLTDDQRIEVTRTSMALLADYDTQLQSLKRSAGPDTEDSWFGYMGLFPTFFEYHLRRLGRFSEIYDVVRAHKQEIDSGNSLAVPVRESIVAKYEEIYAWAHRYDEALRKVPGAMLADTQNKTLPYKEWMAGYDAWLDPHLERPQFAGTIAVSPAEILAGDAFRLRVEIRNLGICPWVAEAGQRIELSGAAEQLGLPASWTFDGDLMVPGDRRTIEFSGTAPSEPGSADITLALFNPYRAPTRCAETTVRINWN
jgi:hypothetical protein